jgi:putative CocE/NonD family hydrolase
VELVSYYLDSDGAANSRVGNGRLVAGKPPKAGSDVFTYDPMHPVPSVGGQSCCFAVLPGGSFDQGSVEMRNDVLVYTTPPLTEAVDVAGNIEVSLYLSSDVKDTDLMVKLVDVDPQGRAWNLDEGVQRVRWREGYEKPVFMEAGKVYKVDVPPLVTSNSFGAGHRIRLEITSSSFPHFERNLNTGGNNYDEKDGVVARNRIHHGPAYPSRIVLPIVKQSSASSSR